MTVAAAVHNGQPSASRDGRGRFLPGHGMGGRPKELHDLKVWARGVIEQHGMRTLVEMLMGDGEDRRFALRALLEYGYGRPQQNVEVSGGTVNLLRIVHAEDAALLGLPAAE